MYNDIHPKEALELYIILKFDKNDYVLQDTFYAIYNLASYEENDISKIIYKIKDVLMENNSIMNIHDKFLSSQYHRLKDVYLNLSINQYINEPSYTNLYIKSYETIRKVYLNYNLNILLEQYNNKQKIYTILDNLSSDKDNKQYKENINEQFYSLLEAISGYADKEQVEGYKYYFENNSKLIMTVFDINMKDIQFKQLNQLANLKNREKNAKQLTKNILNEQSISYPYKQVACKFFLKSIICNVIVELLLSLYFNPFRIYKSLSSQSNSYSLIPFVIYIIITMFIGISILMDIIRLILLKKKHVKSIYGYISRVARDHNRVRRIIYLYFPQYDMKKSIYKGYFTSKWFGKMDRILLIQICGKNICILCNEKEDCNEI